MILLLPCTFLTWYSSLSELLYLLSRNTYVFIRMSFPMDIRKFWVNYDFMFTITARRGYVTSEKVKERSLHSSVLGVLFLKLLLFVYVWYKIIYLHEENAAHNRRFWTSRTWLESDVLIVELMQNFPVHAICYTVG